MEGLVLLPALVVSLSAGALWLVRRRRKRAAVVREAPAVATPAPPVVAVPQPSQMRPLLCPTCNGQYPPGLRYCPLDARALVQNSEWSVGAPVVQVACKACHRSFEPSTRFCPYDAQELAPATNAGVPVPAVPARPKGGKICPRCTERYGGGEAFCGRDGSELVTLN